MKCPECGADGRVEVRYLCPNRRCRLYGQDCAVETLAQPQSEPEEKA